jgi:NADH-quinone oxidoreductase subunit L
VLSDVTSWLVWIFPLIASLFVPVIARFGGKVRDYFVVAVTFVTAALAFTLIPDAYLGTTRITGFSIPWIPSSGGSAGINAGVMIDPLSVLFTVLVAFFGVIIAVYSLGYMSKESNLTRYYFYLLLFIGSMIGLVISDNFLQLFIFWEMVGLCSYSLISFWNNRPESVRSGIKVFIMTRLGDVCLLGAIGIIYANLGTFSFSYTVSHIGFLPPSSLTAVAFLILGAAIAKSAQLPLFTWLYSAMEAPTSVSALLHAATMVKAGIYLVARFVLILGVTGALAASIPYWLPTVAWVGVLTAFIGATLALTTSDIKGVLAYSTVSQLGFMMAALGTVAASSSGWFASLFHMMSHAFFEGLGFLLAGGIIHAIGTRDMRLMGGLRKAMPITFGLALVMILTTSGIPPFAAFFSKSLIITSITETGNLLQTILIYATTALTFAYSLRFLKLTFLGKESEHLEKLHPHEAPRIMLIPAGILAALCVVWGLSGPWIGSFMGINFNVDLLGTFFSLESAIFFGLLIPTGLLIYLAYFKGSSVMAKVRSPSNPLSKLLNNAYFFDAFYEKVILGAVNGLSRGLNFIEVKGFVQFPQAIGVGVVDLGGWVHKYFDVAADRSLDSMARRTQESASRLKTLDEKADSLMDSVAKRATSSKRGKITSSSLQLYITAAALGFALIVVLILLTVGV